MRALEIAATGMNAQQTNLEVIANNIANINTTGFKRARAEFTDLLYQTERLPGVPNQANQNIVPEGASIGLGVNRPGHAVTSISAAGLPSSRANPLHGVTISTSATSFSRTASPSALDFKITDSNASGLFNRPDTTTV